MTPKSSYEKEIDRLFENGRPTKYPKNQLIHYQGDPMSHVYLVKEGHLKAYTILDSGDTRTLLLLSPGDIFPIAFSVTLDWEKYHVKYFYQTLTNVTLQAVDSAAFKQRVESDSKMMGTYLTYLAASNQAILNQLEVMKNKKAINKVDLLLPYMVQKLGERVNRTTFRLAIRLSHQEVADLSGVTRETTTALVKQLEKSGVIEQEHGYWIIHMDKASAGPFDED